MPACIAGDIPACLAAGLLEGGTCSQGGCLLLGGLLPGGCLLLGVPAQGGVWWRPPRTATAVGGMHPTGMHSCLTHVHIITYNNIKYAPKNF